MKTQDLVETRVENRNLEMFSPMISHYAEAYFNELNESGESATYISMLDYIVYNMMQDLFKLKQPDYERIVSDYINKHYNF